jgi:replicative DNA helicase
MKSKTDFSFGVHFQNDCLALMLQDLGFALKVMKFVPEERLYSDAHKYLFKLIKDRAEKGHLLSYVKVEDELKRVDPSKRRVLKHFCKQIFDRRPADPEFIKVELTEYAKKNAFIEVFMDAQTLWNSKKHADAYKFVMEGINGLYGITFKDDAIIPLESFEDIRQQYITSSVMKVKRIPTGISPLDEVLRGGLEKGELGILLAEPKKGKSIGLLHMGVAAIQMRFGRTAHFVLEGTTEQTVIRYLSRLSNIPYYRLEKDEISTEEAKYIDRLMKRYISRLDLIPFNQRWNYTVVDIESKLKELEHAGRKPDLVVIDYADLLKSATQQKEIRHEQTAVYRDLKTLAVMKQYAIWTASQAQRPSKDADETYLLRAKDISESYEKVRIADLVATLNQTPEERKNGILRFHLDIYRSNDTDNTIRLLTDFERMIFYSSKYGFASSSDLSHEWMKKRRGK